MTKCDCGKPHQVNLHLDPRLPNSDPVPFEVVFAFNGTKHPSSVSSSGQETEIRLLDNHMGQMITNKDISTMELHHSSATQDKNSSGNDTREIVHYANDCQELRLGIHKPMKSVKVSASSTTSSAGLHDILLSNREMTDLRKIESLCLTLRQSMNNMAHA